MVAIARPISPDGGKKLEFSIMDDIKQPVIGTPSLKGSISGTSTEEDRKKERRQESLEDENDWRQFLLDVKMES